MNNDNKTDIKINKREREGLIRETRAVCLAACDGGRMIIEQGVDATTMVSW